MYQKKRKIIYSAILAWLILLPVFQENSTHFGWGFMPIMLSILLLPGFSIYLSYVIIVNIIECIAQEHNSKIKLFMITSSIPLFLLISCLASFYYIFNR